MGNRAEVIERLSDNRDGLYIFNDLPQDLVQLRVSGFPILSDWYVVYPESKPLSLIAEHFLEFVLKRGSDVLPMENLERQVQRALAQV